MKGNSRRISPIKFFLPTLLLVGAFLVLFFIVPRVLYLVAAGVMYPIQQTQSWFAESTASFPSFIRNRSELINEISNLEQAIAERDGDRFTLDSLIKENDELRILLGYEEDERIMAGVIARPNQLPSDVLIIDRGSIHGIVAGAPVYAGERTVIGFVHATSKNSAAVTLITSPGFSSTVYVFGPDIYTSAVGIGGGQLRVGVPQGVPLALGNTVVLPAVTSGVYGQISHIESVDTQSEQFGFVSPKLPLTSLRLVSVGRSALLGTDYVTASLNVDAVRNELFTVLVPEELLATTSTEVVDNVEATTTVNTSSD